MDLQPSYDLISARKIQILQGEDILQWRHSSQGTFNIQEPYAIKATSNHPPPGKVWSKIWSLKNCAKISTFLCLVTHCSILTWDNLMKWGFTGPSICLLYLKDTESQTYLLNLYTYISQVWDQWTSIMHTSYHKWECLNTTIEEWWDVAFQSPVLNCMCQLLPSFIL